jgi:pyridoxine 5'-phosphate synthase PdxJ
VTSEIIDFALEIVPDMVTLVPEKRKELTTEGGLDILGNSKKVGKAVEKMRKAGIPVSIFVDPDATQVQAALDLGATFVELHTGRYCDARSAEEQEQQFHLIEQTAELAYESGLPVNASDVRSVRSLLRRSPVASPVYPATPSRAGSRTPRAGRRRRTGGAAASRDPRRARLGGAPT